MRQSFFIIFFILNIKFILLGQQTPLTSHYSINKYSENVAFGGMERSLSIFASYRDHLYRFPGSPKITYIGMDLPLYDFSSAAGFSLRNQRFGSFNSVDFRVSYNYVIPSKIGLFSFGLSPGIHFLTLEGSDIITPEGTYEIIKNHNDPILDNFNMSGQGFTWQMAAGFVSSNFQVGISANNLIQSRIKLANANYLQKPTYTTFGQFKYVFEDKMVLLPSMLVRTDGNFVQMELGSNLLFKTDLLVGLHFRGYSKSSVESLIFLFGTPVYGKIKIFYSFDMGLSSLGRYTDGSHEISINYNLGKELKLRKRPRIIYNPRDL